MLSLEHFCVAREKEVIGETMDKIIATTNVETLLNVHNGDLFAALEAIDKDYKRGIITQHEAFLMIDVLTIYF